MTWTLVYARKSLQAAKLWHLVQELAAEVDRDVDLVDLTMHAARIGKLRLPQESRDAFALLERAGWIQSELSQCMQAVVGAKT